MSVLDKVSNQKLMLVALLLLAIYPVAILAARLDVWHFRTSFLLFIVSALLGFGVLVMAIFKMSKLGSAETQASPARYLLITVAATLLPLMVLGSNIYKAQQYPFIHDITTDTVNPPMFEAVAKDRSETDHSVDYEGQALADTQQTSYPNIKPLIFNKDIQNVWDAVNAQVEENGWQLLNAQSEQVPYLLEASTSSALFGFKDDMVIRVQGKDQAVQVDMRSMSRQGKSDLGMNAKRIQGFFDALQKRLK
jgi:uncharacterized protein (DUF1499 family)